MQVTRNIRACSISRLQTDDMLQMFYLLKMRNAEAATSPSINNNAYTEPNHYTAPNASLHHHSYLGLPNSYQAHLILAPQPVHGIQSDGPREENLLNFEGGGGDGGDGTGVDQTVAERGRNDVIVGVDGASLV